MRKDDLRLDTRHIDLTDPDTARARSGCCMGSRLAMALDKEGMGLRFMLWGVDAWARQLGGHRLHALVLLNLGGATRNPFGPHPWDNTIERVANYIHTQTVRRVLPDLRRYDLTGLLLSHADFRDADLSDLNLTGCKIAYADLQGAALDRTDLTDCKMAYANLSGASLRGANLTRTDLRSANLMEADLQDAILQDTWLDNAIGVA